MREKKKDFLKLYHCMRLLPSSDRHLVQAELEMQSKKMRLKLAEMKAASEKAEVESQIRIAAWREQCKNDAPPRSELSELNASIFRSIRADIAEKAKDQAATADRCMQQGRELASRRSTSQADEKRKRSRATEDWQTKPRQALLIGGTEIKGVEWGNESHEARRCGILSEMRDAMSVFDLSRTTSGHRGSNAATTFETLEKAVRSIVDEPYVARFKVGITWNPPYRWANETYGYMQCYSRMHILLVDDSRMCGVCEAFVIKAFKQHAKIANVKAGDDNRQNVSPHYLYLVTKFAVTMEQ